MRRIEISLILILCAPVVVSCASGSAVEASIHSASKCVWETLDDVYTKLSRETALLQVRRNRCECDDVLEFEVNIYGQWRHVFLEENADLEALRLEASRYEEGFAFKFYFDFTSEIYVSKQGQKFYVLRAVVKK